MQQIMIDVSRMRLALLFFLCAGCECEKGLARAAQKGVRSGSDKSGRTLTIQEIYCKEECESKSGKVTWDLGPIVS